jgi:hypothetical protein
LRNREPSGRRFRAISQNLEGIFNSLRKIKASRKAPGMLRLVTLALQRPLR